jgi:cytochrome P450
MTMATALAEQSIVDPALIACPWPYYAQLHAEAPVHRDATTGMWIIARYADMQAIIKDTKRFSNDLNFVGRRPTPVPDEALRILAQEGYARPQCLQRNDPPAHGRFRRLVDRAFTASRVRELQPYIDEVAAGLVAALPAGEPVDFVRAFAIPLPCIVIADQLGVDRADIPLLKTWTDALLDPVGMMITPEREIECARQVVAFQRYFAARIAERRAKPREDILSTLAAAMDGEAALSTEEVLNLLEQLLTGGNETTTNSIGAGLLLLIDHPEQQELLRSNRALMGNFVEEVLRMETPVQGLFRQTTCDVAVGDVVIPEGAVVMLRHGAVNRDPAKFPEPDRFDIRRGNAGAQLGFGAGVHFCPGAMLARAELASAFTHLLDRFSSVRLAGARTDIAYQASFFLRGLRRLDVVFEE